MMNYLFLIVVVLDLGADADPDGSHMIDNDDCLMIA